MKFLGWEMQRVEDTDWTRSSTAYWTCLIQYKYHTLYVRTYCAQKQYYAQFTLGGQHGRGWTSPTGFATEVEAVAAAETEVFAFLDAQVNTIQRLRDHLKGSGNEA